MKKKIVLISFLTLLIISLTVASYSLGLQEDLSQRVVRLHILANSDSEEDQQLKMLVRDRILKEGRIIFGGCTDKEQTYRLLRENTQMLTAAAEDEIKSHGYDYDVTVESGKFDFPMKIYDNFAFPCGEYDAVRIKIGEAQGQNWWCVMFPPLCFVDAAVESGDAQEAFRDGLSPQELDVISVQDGVDIRFKVVDFVENSYKTIKTALKKD